MKFLRSFLLFLYPTLSFALCPIYNSQNLKIGHLNDGVSYLLFISSKCPSNVLEWNREIERAGLKHAPSMVANRGRNNPDMGSFSFFESVTGKFEFFYGHFTDKHQNKIVLDQSSAPNKLLIELIAWDFKKKAYNFYELRGKDNISSRWFYRGDSFDALKDNTFLYRDNGSQPKFGSRMRCSACHNSGGPIMKELSFPHNDWWTSKRSLIFGLNQLDQKIAEYVKAIVPAEKFSEKVREGIRRLANSPTYRLAKSQMSLQEKLRPLFCEQEINIESSDSSKEINIPSAFFINPLIGRNIVKLSQAEYTDLLKKYKMKFPETDFMDSDHAWLTPVKGYSDLLAIQDLINDKVISPYFADAILKFDQDFPLFSKKRCDLLKKVPEVPSANWEKNFLGQISYPLRPTSTDKFKKLLGVREAALRSEISRNPLGQILEPGFRVIFPKSN